MMSAIIKFYLISNFSSIDLKPTFILSNQPKKAKKQKQKKIENKNYCGHAFA